MKIESTYFKDRDIKNQLYNFLNNKGFGRSDYGNDQNPSYCLDYECGTIELKLYINDNSIDPMIEDYKYHVILNSYCAEIEEHTLSTNSANEIIKHLTETINKVPQLQTI